jgi:hypothetical protein
MRLIWLAVQVLGSPLSYPFGPAGSVGDVEEDGGGQPMMRPTRSATLLVVLALPTSQNGKRTSV